MLIRYLPMGTILRSMIVVVWALACGCASDGLWEGHGAEYRAEFEQHKAAVLAATDAESEAKALRELGLWFAERPYGYTLSTPSQPNANGVDLSRLKDGEPVELSRHMKSDYEPRGGGFMFVPKDKMNLLLLEGKPRAGR
jgi:hypothetical protein